MAGHRLAECRAALLGSTALRIVTDDQGKRESGRILPISQHMIAVVEALDHPFEPRQGLRPAGTTLHWPARLSPKGFRLSVPGRGAKASFSACTSYHEEASDTRVTPTIRRNNQP